MVNFKLFLKMKSYPSPSALPSALPRPLHLHKKSNEKMHFPHKKVKLYRFRKSPVSPVFCLKIRSYFSCCLLSRSLILQTRQVYKPFVLIRRSTISLTYQGTHRKDLSRNLPADSTALPSPFNLNYIFVLLDFLLGESGSLAYNFSLVFFCMVMNIFLSYMPLP